MREIRMNPKRTRHNAAVQGHQLRGQASGSRHTDLLTEHGANCSFKAVPAARRSQSGPLSHQRSESRIAGEMVINGLDVGSQIEEASNARDDGRERLHIGEANSDSKALSFWKVSYLDASELSAGFNGAKITPGLDDFDAANSAGAEEGQQRFPVVRRPIPKAEDHIFLFISGNAFSAQGCGRAMEKAAKRLIESPQAAETGGHRHFRHGHAGIVDQLLGEEYSPRLCDGDGRRSEMLKKKPPELTLPHAESGCEVVDAVAIAVEAAFCNESKSPRDGV